MFTENPDKFIHNSTVGIHAVSPDGYIVYANQWELDMLGYVKDEYIGHHEDEFQIDLDALAEFFQRLTVKGVVKNCPARVQGKFGIKYILYNSSVYEEEGEFIHTRCFATEIDEDMYLAFKERNPYGS